MTDPLNGLRFDIYERVHLPDDVAAIGELDEIELVPHMQALTEEDQVLLKGHLLLSGIYRSPSGEDGVSQLEHWIPVEISLPPSRVERVEDLAVEIDNFDVDLLSIRSLNVTGVISLQGLQAEPLRTPVWRDESFTVVHQAPTEPEEERRAGPALPEFDFDRSSGPSATDRDLEQPPELSYTPEWKFEAEPDDAYGPYGHTPAAETPPQTSPFYASSGGRTSGVWPYGQSADNGWGDVSSRKPETEETRLPVGEPDTYGNGGNAVWSPAGQDSSAHEQQEQQAPRNPIASAEEWLESYSQAPPEHPPEEKPADKPEMKVALGGKPLATSAKEPSGVGLLSMLGEKGAAREMEQQASRTAIAETGEYGSSKASTGDELEWTKLFLGKDGAGDQPFRKVKMCIVQREETLDSIAARYNLQPRELQARNRLSDPYVSEGQVLYIP